ncbi:MAG: glycogen/starch synthase, partial [Myxococcales bacterium]|nr:glycogen/starch synthase [Myxococcales bacterium]
MNILLVTPSADDTAPLGASVAALAKTLRSLDHEVTIVSPLYSTIDPTARSLARRLSKLPVNHAGDDQGVTIYDARSSEGVQQVFLGHEAFLAPFDREMAAKRSGDDASKLFAMAVVALMEKVEASFHAVHAFDWVGAEALIALRESAGPDSPFAEVRTLLTLGELEPITVIKAAAPYADHITTWNTGDEAALRDTLGTAGEPLQSKLSDVLRTVSLGVDAGVWNPVTDPLLESRFDPLDRTNKKTCRAFLERRLELTDKGDEAFVVAFFGRGQEAGFQKLLSVLGDALRNPLRITLGLQGGLAWDGDPEALRDEYPRQLRIVSGIGTEDVHALLGAADLCLLSETDATGVPTTVPMPMVAQRYGALPIAPATKWNRDTIVDCDETLTTG